MAALAPAVPADEQRAFMERADLLRRLLVGEDVFSAKQFIAEEVAGAVHV